MNQFTSFGKRLLRRGISTAVISTIMGTMLAMPAYAKNNPKPTIKADAPNRYVVKKGDTLWDVAGKYLEKPSQWKQIWTTNKQIKNPNLIYPDDVLIMCIIKGKTLVGVDTGEGCAGVEKQVTGKLVPKRVQIRPVSNSIPAIPLTTIRQWLDKVTLVNQQDFENTPYVFASEKGNLLTDVGSRIYARNPKLMANSLQINQRYGIYREEEVYKDPVTSQAIGVEVRQVASGIVRDVTPDGTYSIDLKNNYASEVREGDRVFIEMENDIPPVFRLQPAQVDRGGQIVSVIGSIDQAAKRSIIAVNLGRVNGAKPGDIFTVYSKGKLIRDIRDDDSPVRLPSEPVATVMIFKTQDMLSYAYVLDAELPIGVGDKLLPAS